MEPDRRPSRGRRTYGAPGRPRPGRPRSPARGRAIDRRCRSRSRRRRGTPAEVRRPQGVPQPRPAVEERDAAHPVGVLVQHQQVERLADPAQQGEGDVVEVARAVEGHGGTVGRHRVVQPAAKPVEGAEIAGQPDPRPPVAGRHPLGRRVREQLGLWGEAAVQVQDPDPQHRGMSLQSEQPAGPAPCRRRLSRPSRLSSADRAGSAIVRRRGPAFVDVPPLRIQERRRIRRKSYRTFLPSRPGFSE